MKKGKIFILSGPSGVGKGTVRSMLDMEALNMVNSVSMTTRDPREGETDGVSYYFVTPERFEQAVKNNELVEHNGHFSKAYGTPRKPMEENLANGVNVLLEIEVNGAAKVMEQYPEAVSIFLAPPAIEELPGRIEHRGSQESPEEIADRLAKAALEIQEKDKFKYCVVNDVLEDAVAQVTGIMKQEIEKD